MTSIKAHFITHQTGANSDFNQPTPRRFQFYILFSFRLPYAIS
ncbi:MAG: hypothetical protein HLUCCO02_02520 [Idiomarinaceae bacterium HL-53]|nr:MAG: hypothetical protein HLUCCO02_02520 [Idiomarinaceae bacterium HL-53]